MKAGAYDYVAKPFKQDEVLLALAKAEEREALRRENRALKEAARQDRELTELLGESAAIRQVLRLIDKVAEYRTTVLIQGESGTGKELVARALHRRSPRIDKPFVAINCGAIPESADGERAVRAQARRVHRRAQRQARHLPGSRRRHAVPRRDRRAGAARCR